MSAPREDCKRYSGAPLEPVAPKSLENSHKGPWYESRTPDDSGPWRADSPTPPASDSDPATAYRRRLLTAAARGLDRQQQRPRVARGKR